MAKNNLVRYVPLIGSPAWMSWDEADSEYQKDIELYDKLKSCNALSEKNEEWARNGGIQSLKVTH